RRLKAEMKLLLYTMFLGILLSANAAAAPESISFAGRLTDSSGKPLQGLVNLQLDFYRSETGSDIINVVIPSFANVALNEGIFQIQLDLNSADLHTVFNGKDPVWIQITNLTNNLVYPRQSFNATPHALKVPVDDKLVE